MGYIKDIKIGNGTANLIEPILYGTTNTAAGTQAKVVSISNFELVTGVTVAVKFTVTNTHATPQLNINSTGAKSIKYRGGNLPSAATLTANRVYQFVYDGTNWELIGDLDTNTQTITGVKGNAETIYRTGQVNLTPANIGAVATSGNETIAGNKTFSGITVLDPSSTYIASIGTVIGVNGAAIIQSPIPKYLWHDVMAFPTDKRIPKYYTTTNGSTWTEATLNKKLFCHIGNWGGQIILSDSILGSRWQWTNWGAWTSGMWLVIGIAYHTPICYYDISLEQSSDGSTWTSLCSAIGIHLSAQPIWIRTDGPSVNNLRLTITRNSSSQSESMLPIVSIMYLTSRWGNQGLGPEIEYPYIWDENFNIQPLINNTSTLGSSSLKWANIYATTFTGNLTGNVDGTASKATADADGNTISSTYLKLSGGTLTGALNTANGTWNTMGDDAYFGDINKAGHIGIKGKNGNTGLLFVTYNQSSNTTGGAITWDGTKFSITSTTAIDASISGSAGSVALSGVTGADDLKAIEALSGTSGFLKKTAANTWTLDTNTYLTSSTGVTSIAGKTGAVTLADLGLSNAMHFLGVTTTNISTGTPNTTATVSISGSNVTAAAGDVVLYGSQEYVWGNNKWNLLGDESSYALKATTLAGYGITDAKIANGVITLGNNTITPLTSQYTTHLYVNATSGGATSNATTTNTTTYIHLYDTSTKRETIQLKGAGGATVTAESGVITITSANDDVKVKQTSTANNANYKLLTTTSASPSPSSAAEAYYSANITANPLTGSISAQRHTLNLGGTDKAYMTWNNTDQSIDFIFE